MKLNAKLAICAAAALMTSGCTVEELQSFTIGATAALVLVSATQDNNQGSGGVDCDRGYRAEVGYDEYDEPVYFCVPSDEYYSQEELDALARQPR